MSGRRRLKREKDKFEADEEQAAEKSTIGVE